MKPIRLAGSVSLAAAEGEKPRRLHVVGYTGAPMRLNGFASPVVVAVDGLKLPASVPILKDHDATVSGIVGTGTPRLSAGHLTLDVVVADTAAGREVVALLEAGHQLQASIGANPTRPLESIRAGDKITANGRTVTAQAGGLLYVAEADLREVSILPIGADGDTSVTLTASAAPGATPMTFDEWLTGLGLTDVSDAARTELEKLYALANDPEETAKPLPTPAATNANAEVELRAAQLAAMRAQLKRPPSNIVNRGYGVAVEKQAMEAGVLIRAGFTAAAERSFSSQVLDVARRYQTMSLVDLAGHNLRASGAAVPHDRGEMIRAAFSSASLSTMFSNVSGKILETVWREQPATWQNFAAVRSAKDFKQQTSLRPTFANTLAPLPETGKIDHGTMNEEYFTWKIASYAKMYTFDRQAIINDDLASFSEIMPGFVKAAARTLSDLVYATLLADADTFFTTARGNKLVSSALAGDKLGNAIKAMKLMTDGSGNALDMAPAFLIVPPSLEQTARGILESSEIARSTASDSQLPTGNTMRSAAKLVVESRLENGCRNPYTAALQNGSSTTWFAAASPADIPMVVGFLDGKTAPTVESFGLNADPNRLAMSWRVYHDFGCALGDYRAFLKAVTAGS